MLRHIRIDKKNSSGNKKTVFCNNVNNRNTVYSTHVCLLNYVITSCQTTVMGRGVKLGGSGGFVTIQDIATGIIVSGYGQTQEVMY